jgi:DNA-binding winged helix-turn-helix (wHTH) protein
MREGVRSRLPDAGATHEPSRLCFGACEIDAATRCLERNGEPVKVEPRVFDVLIFLIERRERVVSSGELLDALWRGVSVTSSSLSRAVCKARVAVGDDGEKQRIIATAQRHGFRFVAPVRRERREASPSEAPTGCPAGFKAFADCP